MMKEVTGDILLTSARAIAHGVAPDDHFDNGLARQLRERWPQLAKDFRHWFHTAHPKPGDLWTWPTPDGVRIVNLITQEPATADHAKPGRAKLASVNHALRGLAKLIAEEKIASVALPRLSTGVGGLAWQEVQPLLEQHLGALAIPISVYTTYRAGVVAHE
jgi:O-acetyl-ADP-ribose deacetylase (regulator of RNase III)